MIASSNNLLIFILALSFLLFTHELGHFLVGRLFKIKAEEFGFGYPPKLVKLFTWKGTDFTLNWIPFGAFVRFKGEEDPNVEGGFFHADKWARFWTILAGPATSILVGILLFSLVISQSGYPITDTIQISGVAPDSPAYQAGIQENDQFIAINGMAIESMEDVSTVVQDNLEESIELELLRDGELVTVSLVPRENPPEGEGAMGVIMAYPIEKTGFIRSLPLGARLAWDQFATILRLPGMVMRGEVAGEELRPVSPKGLYDVYAQVRESEQQYEEEQPSLAFLNIAWFFGIISTALGYSNLLPIPALDGGRLLFILPEIILGKRVPPKYENAIHMTGYVLLLILMAYVLLQDFINPIVLPY
jgi:regulator of sigma E protease